MRVAHSRLRLSVAQQAADHRQGSALRNRNAGKLMAQIMRDETGLAAMRDPGCRADRAPRRFDRGQMMPALFARKDPFADDLVAPAFDQAQRWHTERQMMHLTLLGMARRFVPDPALEVEF